MNRKLFVIGVIALLGAILVAGCTEDIADEIEGFTAECQTNDDCGSDQLMCSDGECVPRGSPGPGGGIQ